MKHAKIKTAYTLVELLVCLIIIALVIAAFAPIFTKKVSNNKVSILGISTANTEIHDLFLPFDDSKNTTSDYHECQDVTDTNGIKTLKCKIKGIDKAKVNVLIVGGGGGGAGADSYGDAEARVDHYSTGTHTFPVSKRMKNINYYAFAPGWDGGDAYFQKTFKTTTTYIESCPENSTEITLSDGSKYCGVDYNIRPKDITQLENYANFSHIPDAVALEEKTALDITLNQTGGMEDPKCRITPEETCSNVNISKYPGCGRTVCNKQAADMMCAMLDLGGNSCKDKDGNAISCQGQWMLADSRFVSRSAQFCGYTSFTVNPCYGGSNHYTCSNLICSSIKRDNIQYCPSCIWDASSVASTGDYRSVRCVLLKSDANASFIANSGAGGMSGPYISSNIQSYVETCFENDFDCSFELAIENPGTSPETSIKIVRTGGSVYEKHLGYVRNVGYCTVMDGSATDFGRNTQNCQASDRCCTDWTCSSYTPSGLFCTSNGGLAGKNGTPGEGTMAEPSDVFIPAQGGIGAQGHAYKDGTIYGSGGDGGSVLSENPTAEEMKGKPGQPGHVILEYILLYKGASGGGGGGAGYAMVKDIDITPNQEYEIQIGGGGKGGTEGENGINGGDTIVTFNSKTYKAFGGKGGKTGKSEDDESDERIAGIGGEGGKIEGVNPSAGIGGSQEGQRGSDGTIDSDFLAAGGSGGRSGISMSTNIVDIACGGLYFDNNISCLNQDKQDGLGATYLNALTPKPVHIYKESSLGSYGAGGGGGGWRYIENTGADAVSGVFAGKGGDGQGGYVYIWW